MESTGELYEIRVGGVIGPEWADWFDGLLVRTEESGDTIITGRVTDQAALRGLIDRIADLNLCLVSVNPVAEPGSTDGHPCEKEEEKR